MKLKHLVLAILVVACQKEQKQNQTNVLKADIKETAVVKDKFLKTDTITISDGEDSFSKDYILANLVKENMDKDSIVTSHYQLDFYENKVKTASSKVAIKGNEKGSEWSASFGLNDVKKSKSSPFLHVSYGYPACGYAHDHFLFYLKNNEAELVYSWLTISDSGWGSWVEFYSQDVDSETKKFYCKNVAFEPADGDDENLGVVSYSDSTSFEFKNNHWNKILLSAKDKNYFQKTMSFDEFHNTK
ncbi:hypothetical protein [Flavobacterium foetidum]|uniref:hypothetical protein n=1 Tax=Flavobacterium foetidum TaxID=2026681 RepID=UPI0010753117|nr:hypothetical protein [Flavobacterium foetidum]KAF2509144.1 hypothetical protein E0W73_19240 [Flavobacterium foetidum]